MSDLLRKDKKTEKINVPDVVDDISNKHPSASSLLENARSFTFLKVDMISLQPQEQALTCPRQLSRPHSSNQQLDV